MEAKQRQRAQAQELPAPPPRDWGRQKERDQQSQPAEARDLALDRGLRVILIVDVDAAVGLQAQGKICAHERAYQPDLQPTVEGEYHRRGEGEHEHDDQELGEEGQP